MVRASVLFLICMLCPALAIAQDTTPPSPITTLEVTTGKSTMVVAWQNTGDDGTTGNAELYEVRRSSSSITDRESADLVASGSAGSTGSWTCTDYSSLSCSSPFYVTVFLRDEAGNWSSLGTVLYRPTQGCNTSEEVICFNLLRTPRGASERTSKAEPTELIWPSA